ncbi:hypothetical protein ASG46_10185 [Bacillus sp. Leaf49]|uniref:terminase large subunit n=1 Tax=Bacillus sp. Leaf49 TaxID=1736222 RepID=UPI0006FB9B30|nr:terminase TerL endonuclease subunit [Bacillus sp. Leaf49]KQU11563.1 hypothetical protein ASG46_10185 [Bacillus sp. Leaf49]
MNRVTEYATKVLNGEIVAGELVKLACKRHMDDLDRQGTEDFPYVFDEDKANRVLKFFEKLKFTSGESDTKGKLIELKLFQCFILGSVFGWIHMESGYRRFNKSFNLLARKNSKSLLNSGIGLYMTGFDGYTGAQTYMTATIRSQARICWKETANFIKEDKDLLKMFKIREHASEIECKINGGTIVALGKDTGTIDGFNPHCGIIDEYHAHKDNQMVKLLEKGTVRQKQSLISIISTAGYDSTSPCKIEQDYCEKILKGVVKNDKYFVYIAQLDKKDDPFDAKNFIKANPLAAEDKDSLEKLIDFSKEAKEKQGDDLKDYLIKSMNVWMDSKQQSSYMPIEKWKAAGLDKGEFPDLKGTECYVGIDLATTDDNCSVSTIHPLPDGRFAVQSHSFVPDEMMQYKIKNEKAPYDLWEREGWITRIPGAVNDYRDVVKWIIDMAKKEDWKVKQVHYDAFDASQVRILLEEEGYTVVETPQKAVNLSPATKNFKHLVFQNRVIHDNNPLLTYSMYNAVTDGDEYAYKLSKKKSKEKIDSVAALMNAHTGAMLHEYSNSLDKHILKDDFGF